MLSASITGHVAFVLAMIDRHVLPIGIVADCWRFTNISLLRHYRRSVLSFRLADQ